jgi:two-component system chemotaxis response regulator CheB
MIELVVIGCSWGGLEALGRVLDGLPADLGVPVAATQHRGPEGDDTLATVLQQRSRLRVREVEDKDLLTPGYLHLAPTDYHLLVDGDSFALSTDERVRYSRPSIDVLFESAADAFGPGLLAVLLTGANADGTAGLQHVRSRGGYALVQDPATAERPAMPASAIAAGAVDVVAPLDGIADAILDHCRPGRRLRGRGAA